MLYAYFLHYSWTIPIQSDSANYLLMSRAMLRGNLFLHGWYLSYDPFWLTDLPIYAIGILVRGMTPALLHDVPALLWTIAVLIAFELMCPGTNPRRRWPILALSLLALIAIPSFFASFALEGPVHIGTLDVVLGSLLLMEYRNQIDVRLYWSGSITLFAIAILSDPFAIWMYYLPLALYSVVTALRSSPHSLWGGTTPFVATTVALIAADGLKAGIGMLGGLHTAVLPAQFVAYDHLGANLSLLVQGLLALYGANFFGQAVNPLSAASLVRLGFAILSLSVVVRVVYRWARYGQEDGARVVASLAAILLVLEYCFSTTPVDMGTSRYLLPVIVFAIIVTARTIVHPTSGHARWLLPVLGVVVAYSLLMPAVAGVAVPEPVAPPQFLAAWLSKHGLTDGYGSYWDASVITVYSSNHVRVRAVVSNGTRLVPFFWMANPSWYTGTKARFLVFDDSDWGGVNISSAIATWGRPATVSLVGPYTVAIWNHALSAN